MLSGSFILAIVSIISSPCELWEFTSPQCGACRQMEPVIAQLQRQGLPIRQIDASREPQLTQQFGVRSLPTFIVVADGQVLSQVVGRRTGQELTEMLAECERKVPQRATETRPDHFTQSHDSTGRGTSTASITPRALPAGIDSECVQYALEATVRLRIEDATGISFGTGTIVDVHEDEVLVLTCAHIFSAAQGQGNILCDLFVPGGGTNIPGKLISHDVRRDVGLVSLRTNAAVKPVCVGGIGQRPQESNTVFSIGCNRGDDPTVQSNQILAVNRYHGPANLVVGGRPMDGRSGGGLFTRDGVLIGVCNAADQEQDEGLYAALGPIHTELDAAGLGFVYRKQQPQNASRSQATAQLASSRNSLPSAVGIAKVLIPQSDTATISPGTHAVNSDAEIICIVRSPDGKKSGSQVYVLDRPSPNLMQQLSVELDRRGPHALTNSRTSKTTGRTGGGNGTQAEGNWRPAR